MELSKSTHADDFPDFYIHPYIVRRLVKQGIFEIHFSQVLQEFDECFLILYSKQERKRRVYFLIVSRSFGVIFAEG
jgi:truncated hemoglobin YjbI